MSGARRPERLAEQIKEEVSLIVGGELEDPRVAAVTVTDARLSADLKHAKIYVSISGDHQDVRGSLAALKHAAGFIRYQLGSVLRMKRTPELHFVHDQTDETAARIEQLLSEEVSKASENAASESDAAEGGAPQRG